MLKVTTPSGPIEVGSYNEGKAICLKQVHAEMAKVKIYSTLDYSASTKFVCNGKTWIVPKR